MKLEDKTVIANRYSSQCTNCKNLIEWEDSKCKAFNDIPFEILDNKFKHNKKHPKQKNNILFERIK